MTIIAGVWILSVVVSLPPLFGWKRPQPVVDGFPLCVLSEEPGYVIYSTIGSFYVPLVVIVVVYSRIFVAARNRARRSLTAGSHGQKSRRGMMSQSTTASSLSNQPRVDQSSQMMSVQHGQASTVEHGVFLVTPTAHPGSSWSEAEASRSEPDEVVEEPEDFDVEQDVESLSDADLDFDDDDVDATSGGPQIVFSTDVTADIVVDRPESRQTSQTTGAGLCSPEEPAVTGILSKVDEVTAERERARRRLARYRERRATVVLGIVMVSFIGCWLPFFFIYPLSLLLDFHVPALPFAVIFWLGYCNSALNPIIYTIFNHEFRAAFRRMLCPGQPLAAKPPSRF